MLSKSACVGVLPIIELKNARWNNENVILDNLLLINHSNTFRPLSRSHHQGVRNPWELQSHCIDLLECCYVYVFTSQYDSCGVLRPISNKLSRINLCISLVYFCLHYWKCTVQKTKQNLGDCFLHHDNGLAHPTLSVNEFMARNKMIIIPHPPTHQV